MNRKPQTRRELLGLLLVAVSVAVSVPGCEVVRRLPVITADTPTFNEDSSDSAKVLTATITQNNGPIDPALRVTCDFTFLRHDEVPAFRTRNATRLSNPRRFQCSFPASTRAAIRDGHVLRFEWLVRSRGSDDTPVVVARTGVRDFAVGCEGADQAGGAWARNQTAVLARFAGLPTIERIGAAGYLPTHFTPDARQKVFKGMGVAFARAVDVGSAAGIVPSLPTRLDSPNLLIFVPTSTVAGDPTLASPAAIFRLVGWAYTTVVDDTTPIDRPPLVNCYPLHEWFIHEQGVHTTDGGFTPNAGPLTVGLRHTRLWDLHVWSRPSGVPQLGILNTGPNGSVTPATGFTPPGGSFFYPEFDEP